MLYRVLADVVVVVHLAFIIFVATGSLLAWRWPAVAWAHLPAVAWGAGTVAIGCPGPLTPLEKSLRAAAGDDGYPGGFVDHYVEGVVYPEEYTGALQALAAAAVLVGYAGLLRRRGARLVGP
ncbi:MAG: DUF2784 domain-containing protein [Acidimicrobiia bacterium]